MEVVKIWSKENGVIFDLLEKYKNQGQAPPEELINLKKVITTEPIDVIEASFAQMEMPLF